MKAIVDWKWGKNGDPLTDVANFTMMFLQPEDVGYQFRYLTGHDLLVGMNLILAPWLCMHQFSSVADQTELRLLPYIYVNRF